jgi:hypothetical protein
MSKGGNGKGGTTLGINFGTRRKMVVTSKADPNCLRYTLNGRLGGPQNEKRKVKKKATSGRVHFFDSNQH